jgi:hypothetical protein
MTTNFDTADRTSDSNILCTVTAAWREPMPGWVDNANGVTGILVEVARGTIRSIICDQKLTMDLIPVDFVVNTLIGVAWHTATYRYTVNNIITYLQPPVAGQLRIL